MSIGDSMDAILQTFFSWQFLTFGVGVSAIVFVLRKIAEYLMANFGWAAKESKLWKDLLMPILPVFVGTIGAMILSSYPYPAGMETVGGRFVFGLVAGSLSTLLYRVAKAFLVKNLKTLDPSASDSEVAPDPVADVKQVLDEVKSADKQ
jgi:hypothetical protein